MKNGPSTGPHRPSAPLLWAFAADLSTILLAGLLLAHCSGCASAPSRRSDATAPHVLVVGERIRALAPGETITVPQPVPPARTWYLVDDEGLWQWLGIQAPNRTFVTNDNQRVTLRRRSAQ